MPGRNLFARLPGTPWFDVVGIAAAVALAALLVYVVPPLVDDIFHSPPAFCPDDGDDDRPHWRSSLNPGQHDGTLLLYAVDDDGMTDMSSQLNGLVPSDFPSRKALICQYGTMTDKRIGSCPTIGSESEGSIPIVRTRYHYKVYALSDKTFLGSFALDGIPRCFVGITTRSALPAEPDYPKIVERVAPLLR